MNVSDVVQLISNKLLKLSKAKNRYRSVVFYNSRFPFFENIGQTFDLHQILGKIAHCKDKLKMIESGDAKRGAHNMPML